MVFSFPEAQAESMLHHTPPSGSQEEEEEEQIHQIHFRELRYHQSFLD